ncbi:hypothetical protein IFM89_031073 [Coptis chinensis]|uniref:Uncharacterized protein n=1 Tax=Coptis chinensis TaxID=261450 RepID=A0A835LW08_9MAGN|nr:hypothetical protein IFM89_031073 [Coptis chinensis]
MALNWFYQLVVLGLLQYEIYPLKVSLILVTSL